MTDTAKPAHPDQARETATSIYCPVHHWKRDSRTYFHEVENYSAIPDVCAWPNLQRLADGTLLVFIFNQPCHGRWEGDVDCWASDDDGRTWQFRGRPAPHEPGANRMNKAVGQTAEGDLVLLCGGYTNRSQVGGPYAPFEGCALRPWVCRSKDGGRTWEHDGDGWPSPDGDGQFWPFGKIHPGADGTLCAAAYSRGTAYLLRSCDDGFTWGDPSPIQVGGNETAILHLGSGRWLAAIRQSVARKGKVSARQWNEDHLELFTSDDDGRIWQHAMPLSLPLQHPADLLRLQDGRILLTYGNRCLNNNGIDARFSEDDGATWTPPIRIGPCDLSARDGGYPSSVELPDGRVVTAYYDCRNTVKGRDRDPGFTAQQARQTPDDQLQLHYELRVSRWHPGEF